MRCLDAPRRMVSAIEGECLFNDVTALVAYRLAVGAVVAGSFSLANAGMRFVLGGAEGSGGWPWCMWCGRCPAAGEQATVDPRGCALACSGRVVLFLRYAAAER